MPPKKRQISDVIGSEDGQISNRDILDAIANLASRVSSFESSITKMVEDKVANLEEGLMNHVSEYKTTTDDRLQQIEGRMVALADEIKFTVDTNRVSANLKIDDSANNDRRIDRLEGKFE